MRLAHAKRWLLLALLLLVIPASSFAGVFISVGFAPPVLPVYVQPVCPQPGLMWTPGYWDYGPDGYFWVPGAWVPAPYAGALWTPPYWGWSGGLYVLHAGYWGPHVGYYGGVNYGFGYMGIGFVGGVWHGGVFSYNSAVMHVGMGGGWAHNTYVDRNIVERNTIVNNNHVAFSGGPGGINHPPTAEERAAEHDRHVGATAAQSQHMAAARADHNAYAKANGGHPQNVAVSRPMTMQNHAAMGARGPAGGANGGVRTNSSYNNGRGAGTTTTRSYSTTRANGVSTTHTTTQTRPTMQARPAARPAPAPRAEAPRGGGEPRGGGGGGREHK